LIELSRKDIVSDNLMAFQEQSRFIKLPMEGYLELLGITLTVHNTQSSMQSITLNIVLYVQLSLEDRAKPTLQIL